MDKAEYALMDAHEGGMWWYRALHARIAAALGAAPGRLLDAGCGTGGLLAALRHSGLSTLVGIEYDAGAAHRAAAKSAAAVAVGSVNALPFADAAFDAAIAADVLCHRAVDPPTALAELRRVLRPGGHLVVNMPAFAWLASAHDLRVHNARRMSAPEVRRMLEAAGFEAVATRYWNFLLLPLMVAQRKLRSRGAAASDVTSFPPWLDAILFAATALERRLPFALPGGSVLATATRPAQQRNPA